MNLIIVLLLYCISCVSFADSNLPIADKVLVNKTERKMYLLKAGKKIRQYNIALGDAPSGHKQQQGDGRTPEGRYTLGYKNSNSKFYKSIHISYPNATDRKNAKKRGVDPGGDIMIHGQRNRWGWLSPIAQLFNWTNGCIALSDRDMDAVWKAVNVGTPIEIRP